MGGHVHEFCTLVIILNFQLYLPVKSKDWLCISVIDSNKKNYIQINEYIFITRSAHVPVTWQTWSD